MAKPLIALATEDFAAYLDLSRHLRAQKIPFQSLIPGTPIPGEIKVVITTDNEQANIQHDHIVTYTTPEATIEETMRLVRGLETVDHIIIGIDPGPRPGLALLADGHLLTARQTPNPEHVVQDVNAIAQRYQDTPLTVRVGHGAQTRRDRIVNGLLEHGHHVELVDETETSPARGRIAGERDKIAARVIAMTTGQPIRTPRTITVPPGEIRDIQRRSRIESDGQITISRHLAGKVAEGLLTLPEAVRIQTAPTR